jgi:hypothetical protein
MSRPLRFIPEDGSLVEITCRTDQGRYLLRPDRVIDDILLGVLGRAQRLYPVEICTFSFNTRQPPIRPPIRAQPSDQKTSRKTIRHCSRKGKW